jgi:hypothetical protein
MTDKPVVHARLNWGKWIADCPVCNDAVNDGEIRVAEAVDPGQDFICSREYPGINAMMWIAYQGHQIQVPDKAARQAARQRAELDGRVYMVIFPPNKTGIEQRVRSRKLAHMNWRPGMTLQDLDHENQKYKVSTKNSQVK